MTPKVAQIIRELERVCDMVRDNDPLTVEEAEKVRKACRDVEWAAIDNFRNDEDF